MRDYDPSTGRYLQPDPLGLVDGASVYGYAGQSPGRFTDPRGEYCVSADGTTTCSIPSLYRVSFPTPKSWEGSAYIGPEDPNYHFYEKSLPSSGMRYDPECLMAGLISTPEPAPSNGATPGGMRNYANPGFLGFADYLRINEVASYSFVDPITGHSGIVNVTVKRHGLSDGIVVRLASPSGILTYGEGNSWLQSPESPFADMINSVWLQANADIMNKCTCGTGL